MPTVSFHPNHRKPGALRTIRDPGGQAAVANVYFSRRIPPGPLFRLSASYVVAREMSIDKEAVDKDQFKQCRRE